MNSVESFSLGSCLTDTAFDGGQQAILFFIIFVVNSNSLKFVLRIKRRSLSLKAISIKWMDGWNGPSIGRMPANARDNLLPRKFFVFSGDADVSCNRTLSFRPVVAPTGFYTIWFASLSESPVLSGFTIILSHPPSR